jgi:2,3-dihydroxybenzoate decarboxylase
MATSNGVQVIAIEEHYNDPELAPLFEGRDARSAPHIVSRLDDLGDLRIGEMDEGGIDIQVLSHSAPATQKLDAETAVRVARNVNDRLKETIDGKPERFQGFAALPTPDPKAAADELERCVDKLGFKGAMIHGLTTGGLFFDDKRFWPIFERAAALDVPLYIHPAIPHPDVIKAYYEDYLEDFPGLLTAGWGFTVETATQGIRLVISGVFDAHPGAKVIMGHLGESLPFSLWRINQALSRDGNQPSAFRDTFCEHFYITTSGNFSDPALLCCIQEMGVDRILFSVDYPFVPTAPGVKWMERLSLSAEDKVKILNGNAKRLLRM